VGKARLPIVVLSIFLHDRRLQHQAAGCKSLSAAMQNKQNGGCLCQMQTWVPNHTLRPLISDTVCVLLHATSDSLPILHSVYIICFLHTNQSHTHAIATSFIFHNSDCLVCSLFHVGTKIYLSLLDEMSTRNTPLQAQRGSSGIASFYFYLWC
jgi:hypothetical protein